MDGNSKLRRRMLNLGSGFGALSGMRAKIWTSLSYHPTRWNDTE